MINALSVRVIRIAACAAALWWFSGNPAHAQPTITTIAGNGRFQFSGSGDFPGNIPFGQIRAVAIDGSSDINGRGNIYGVDQSNGLVFKIPPNGMTTIIAGKWIALAGVTADRSGNVSKMLSESRCSVEMR
jgi:hypothetical protein